jgi:hypothetical protein
MNMSSMALAFVASGGVGILRVDDYRERTQNSRVGRPTNKGLDNKMVKQFLTRGMK